jgi:plastocyanin
MSARRLSAALLAASLAFGAGTAAAANRAVSIKNNQYLPHRVIALTGDTVIWTNNEVISRNHNVVADDGLFTSPVLGLGGVFPWTFASPGFVSYHCTLHPMHGIAAVYDLYFEGPVGSVLHGKTAAVSGYAPETAGTVDINLVDGTANPVATVPVNATTGRFTASIPAVPGMYFAQTASPARTSGNIKIQVRPRLHVTKKRKGKAFWITVSTQPDQQGATITLQRRQGPGWKKFMVRKLGAGSRAVFKVVPKAKLDVRLKLTKPVNGYATATSGTLRLRP